MMSRRYIAFQLSSTFSFPKTHYFLEFAALFLFFSFISSSLQIIIQTMSYAAVASLLQTVDILFNYHQHSISLRFESQIISIHENTSFLQLFIEGSSERVNNWEEAIRKVTNKAEDIIELILSDSLLKLSVGLSRSEMEKEKYELYDELEKVRKEMEWIVNRVKGGRRIQSVEDGSEDEVMEIISRLRGGSVALETIAICGSAGMGKTTLARNAYFHPSIVEHFDVRAGFTVSREYTWVSVIGDLLRSMKSVFSKSDSEDELVECLLQNIGSRRYLILLDDVWSLDVMERLKVMLSDYGNGSRIIITTRSSELANYAHHIHEMRLLDEDQTWNVLQQKIFKGDPCPFQLEAIGKTIARSCGGHPLSIVVVSGILAFDQTEAAWEDVSRNIKIAFEEEGEILNLSYIYLPHHLRPCLLYLGVFREGRVIYVSTLVELWVAEGFLNESEYKSLEETGEEYVKDLVRRNLVSVHNRKSNRRIKSIIVHDLIRGMCRRQAHRDYFNLHLGRDAIVPENIRSCRRVSGANHCGDFLSGVYGSTIRTLMFFPEYDKVDLKCWRNVRLLRILSLLNVDGSSRLSEEVFQLFHLRYLAFYWNFNIPEAVSNLVNLQTLIIYREKEGGMFDKLPEGIWRMPQLRHIYIYRFKFPNEKGPTSVLQNLQTLSRVVDFICSIEILKMFPNLKKLDLVYTTKLRDVVEDYELHSLTCLHKLEVLKIKMDWSYEEEHRMRCVTFPLTLKQLSLHGLQLSWEDMKMVASLPNLEVLKLKKHACVGDTWETREGGFSRLIGLWIEESNLENWITKSSHFPTLWRLVLVRCSGLLEVPYEMADIPTLQQINLDRANHSLFRSAERIQKDRHSFGHNPIYIFDV